MTCWRTLPNFYGRNMNSTQTLQKPLRGEYFPSHSMKPLLLFSHTVMSDSFWPYRLQYSRLPCPSPTPRPCSNSCPPSRWCPPTISSSVVPFSSCLQSFSIRLSDKYSGLTFLRTDWFNLLAVKRTFKSFLQHHSSKASILQCSAFLTVKLSHPYMTTRKTIALTKWTFVGRVMSLLFRLVIMSLLSRLVITFLPRSKHLLISWLIY